jgi:hypothetical protein
MSFDRLRVQQECERLTGCANLKDWPNHRATFEALTLTSHQAQVLASYLIEDGKDLYYKGLLSLCEAIQSMNRHLFSWATVKAYYSVFYLLRSSLALKSYGIVRNKCLYLLPIKPGSSPLKQTSRKYNNDHLCVINLYQDMFATSDILQSNSIDGTNPYEWMMDRRNQVNYNQRQFYDPEPPDFLQIITEKIDLGDFNNLITTYVDDTSYLYCFQPEHACLALPIRRLLLTRNEYYGSGVTLTLTPDRLNLITTLLTIDNTPIQRSQSFI